MDNKKVAKTIKNEINELDKHVLPDTLSSTEWQTLLLSGFLNEYNIAQVDANIENYTNRIKELESLDYSNNEKKPSLIKDTFNTFFVNFSQALFMSLPFYVGYLVVSFIAGIFFKDSLYVILNGIFSFAVKIIMWPAIYFMNYDIENLNVIASLLVGYIGFSIIIGVLFALSNALGFRKRIKKYNENDEILKNNDAEKENALKETKKELEDYQLAANDIKEECKANLKEIYEKNMIPEIYHDYESLGMLYGYFACGAALNFQDAAKEYLQDKRTQAIVNIMTQTNDLLSMIAQGMDVFNMNQEDTNAKLNKLIEQNDRSIIGKLFPNNPISNIYSKAKNAVLKTANK